METKPKQVELAFLNLIYFRKLFFFPLSGEEQKSLLPCLTTEIFSLPYIRQQREMGVCVCVCFVCMCICVSMTVCVCVCAGACVQGCCHAYEMGGWQRSSTASNFSFSLYFFIPISPQHQVCSPISCFLHHGSNRQLKMWRRKSID